MWAHDVAHFGSVAEILLLETRPNESVVARNGLPSTSQYRKNYVVDFHLKFWVPSEISRRLLMGTPHMYKFQPGAPKHREYVVANDGRNGKISSAFLAHDTPSTRKTVSTKRLRAE